MSDVIELSGSELKKLQHIELEMLIEVDRICEKHHIRYSLSGGTLLGAVRHKGFIPWDDDVDVIFHHEEYEKFFLACQTELDRSRFFLQDFRTDAGYRWGYAKLRRIGTEYIKKGQEHLKQKTGICIDLFPLQNVPQGKLRRKLYQKKMFVIRKILYSDMGRKTETSVFMRGLYALLSKIPTNTVHRWRMREIEKFRGIEAENVSCEMFPNPRFPDGLDSKIFDSYDRMEFEGRTFMVTAEWDYLLTAAYGDYMKLPPPEKRKGVMNAVKYSMTDVD